MNNIAMHVIRRLQKRKLTLSTVESMTGGGLVEKLTSVPGASEVILGSLVVYTNDIKQRVLQISKQEFPKQGEISREMARLMAERGLTILQSDIVITVTGNAGPTAHNGQPVGKVFIGLARRHPKTRIQIFEFDFTGSRDEIREATFKTAMELLNEHYLSSGI